jgi:hypothetical protein
VTRWNRSGHGHRHSHTDPDPDPVGTSTEPGPVPAPVRWRTGTGRARGGAAPRAGAGAVPFARLAGVVALTALAAGCGIRTTSIPVNAGPAPSRLPCETSGEDIVIQAEPDVPVRVYLMCASGLTSVERAVTVPRTKSAGDRLKIAQGLLDELQAQPSATERDAGFSTSVRGPLIVSSPRAGDPANTLRLSRQPEDLPTAALAQIVCTFAESPMTDGRVVLGGPGDYPTRTYGCGTDTKRSPDAVLPTLAPSVNASTGGSPTTSAKPGDTVRPGR